MNEKPTPLEADLDARLRELERSLPTTSAADEEPELAVDRETLRALVGSERRYRQLVERGNAFICTHDLEGVLLSVNRAAAESLGYRPEEMTGRSLADFLDPRYGDELEGYLQAARTEPMVIGLMNVVCRNGDVRTWAYRNSRNQEAGEEPYVLAHAQDVTETKRLEETLKLTQFSVDRAADAVFWIAEDGRLRYVNDAACDYLGYSREELLTFSIYDVDVTLDRADWPAHWEQVQRLERLTTETLYRARTGRHFPVEVTVNFLSFRGREYHCVFAREISERKEAEDTLIATTARLEGLIENLPVGILFEDDQRKVVLANQTLCQMLDIPVPPRSLTHADSRTLLEQSKHLFPTPEHFLTRVEQILTSHALVRGEELALEDGRVFARDYVPIVNQNYRAHLWQYRDVTERKRAETEILKAKFEAEKANNAKSSFLAMMSHELRTPLNAILGMTELSLETELNSEQLEFLRTIQTNSENLLRLIDDVLDLSKIEANRMEIEQIPYDLRGLVEEVAESLNVRALSKDVELVLDLDPHLPAEIVGDPKRVRQVLLNLVGNAVKFTEKGFVHLSAEVEDWKPGDRVDLAFTVRDTGVGIPADKQRELFSKFYQADPSTTRKFGGTGLGLNISRSLVDLMGGKIDFTSEAGKGSVFRVNLTTTVPQDTEPNSVAHRAQLSDTRAKVLVSVPLPGRRRALVRTLKAWGLEVEVVESPEELETKLQSEAGELAVTVLEQPSGRLELEAIKRLRRPPRRELVLLASIGANTSAVLTESCPHVVTKPVRQTRLAETLARALGLSVQSLQRVPAVKTEIPNLPHRILLVEDNPDNQKLAARVLTRAGARVDRAENGEIAVTMATKTLYDLVIMDLMMPVMDGFQATARIRELESSPNRVPIVGLTAHATEGFRDRCLAAGMDDYLSKPFKKERLLALVEQWVDRRPIILVADDAAENRLIVKRFLMLGGDYRLLFANNGREALELFTHQSVALVLLDMEMPVLDGYETARTIRETPGGEALPILAMTAHHDPADLKRCLVAGCTTVLQKPLERRALNALVSKLIQPRAASSAPVTSIEESEPTSGDVVRVDPDILDLVPRFLENQRSNVPRLLEMADSGDFDSVRRLGHNMKGTGKGYGFDVISSFGASIEQAAVRSAAVEIQKLVNDLDSYLAAVRWQPRSRP